VVESSRTELTGKKEEVSSKWSHGNLEGEREVKGGGGWRKLHKKLREAPLKAWEIRSPGRKKTIPAENE